MRIAPSLFPPAVVRTNRTQFLYLQIDWEMAGQDRTELDRMRMTIFKFADETNRT